MMYSPICLTQVHILVALLSFLSNLNCLCFVLLLLALVNLRTPQFLAEVAGSCAGICGAAWERVRGP